MSQCSVTTLNGRQTRIEVADLQTLVTNLNPQALMSPGVSSAPGALYQSGAFSLGPALDIVPELLPDHRTLKLALTAAVTEFLGYDPPTNSVTVYIDGKTERASTPRPNLQVRTIGSTVNIPDGQTLVLPGPTATNLATFKSKLPVLGDVPGVGKIFRSTVTQRRQMFVLITPTLINSLGIPLHPAAQPTPPK